MTPEDERFRVRDVPVEDLAVEAPDADEAGHHQFERRRGLSAVADRLVQRVNDLRGRGLPNDDNVAVLVRAVTTWREKDLMKTC